MAFRCFQKSHQALQADEPQPRKTRSDFCLNRREPPQELCILPPPPSVDGSIRLSESVPRWPYRIIGRSKTDDTEESTTSTRKGRVRHGITKRAILQIETAPVPVLKRGQYSQVDQIKDKESLAKWKKKNGISRREEQEEALVAQASFETACQLLHKRILEKEHRLTVSELSFLHRLLDDTMKDESESDLSDRLSAIEGSLHALDEDPLFKTPPTSPDKMMKAKTASRGVATTERTFSVDAPDTPRARNTARSTDQSQSSDDGSTRIEVMSSNSSQFSIEKVLHKASKDKEENELSRKEEPFCADLAFEEALYGTLSEDDEEDGRLQGPPTPYRYHTDSSSSASSPSRRTPERMKKVADEIDSQSPYALVGTIPRHRILSAHLMEAMRGFLPDGVSEQNYWLKYDSSRDKSNMMSLLTKLRATQNTIICIKATDGSVFGSSTSTPWRLQKGWYGASGNNNDAFLFRSLGGKMEVYPYTASDDYVQYCSPQILAVGGGDWQQGDSPYSRNESNGIGLLIDGDLAGGESNSCATFANPRLFDNSTISGGDGDRIMSNEFVIERMEVWTLTPCREVVHAEKHELTQLFLEKKATTTTVASVQDLLQCNKIM